ncbi:MAG: DUF4398 domain-containing protein [Pseudomonadota bacterium]|nr:DUF4398 domain-containing protein [Pseudomonadota bacterium]
MTHPLFSTSRRLTRLAASLTAAGSIVVLAACASPGPPPTSEMATARATIAQAESAGASQSAPVELLAARDHVSKAEAAVRVEKYEDARRLAVQAEADAEVAVSKARAKKAEMAAAEMSRSNDLLRQEIARKRGG